MSNIKIDKSYERDPRDNATIQNQSKIVKYFCDRNQENFEPYLQREMTKLQKELDNSKQSISYTTVQRMQFEDGRFIDYRDSLIEEEYYSNSNPQLEFPNKVIIFITGVPGGVRYYGKMEKSIGSQFCRLINLYTPGFDSLDERRGTYKGGLDELAQLINDFLVRKMIHKAVFIMHSYGGLIAKNFAYAFPQKVEAIVQLASIPLTLWQGYKKHERLEVEKYNINSDTIEFEKLSEDDFRNKFNQILTDAKTAFKSLPKDEYDKLWPVSIFSNQDIMTLIKFKTSVKGRFMEIFQRMRSIQKSIPRMMVYSSQDFVVLPETIEEEIYEFIIGERATKRMVVEKSNSQTEIQNYDFSNINSNYVFRFDDATHSLHHEKGFELGIIIKHYIRSLEKSKIILVNQPNL